MATPRPALGQARTRCPADRLTPRLRPPLTTRLAPGRGARDGRLGTALLLGVAASLALTAVSGSAAATPGEATTPEQAAGLVAEAGHRLEVVTEQVNEAREILEERQAAVGEADRAAADARARLDPLDGQIRQVARMAYTGEGMSQLTLLMTSDSAEDFVSQLSTLDAIAGHTGEVLTEVSVAARDAERAQVRADEAEAEATRVLADVTARQADLEEQIADYRQQFEALTAEQQRQVSEAHAGQAVPASDEASTGQAPAQTRAAAMDAPTAAAGGAARTAVQTALAQIGDSYVWGAGGPDSFDCSGLMQYAYAAAGVSLPHSSRMLSQLGSPVSRDALQPGDLVFFYSPVSHVGMYVGNGQMVHASTYGTPVRVASVDMRSYVGARRVG